jgi:hypothetical protein
MTDTTQQTLTPAEIARVFGLYYDCQVTVTNERYINGEYTGLLKGLSYENPLVLNTSFGSDGYENPNDCKLLLTSLERITDEDAVQVAQIYRANVRGTDNDRKELIRAGREKAMRIQTSFLTSVERVSLPVYQYLISRGYAVPLWFGVDHWANGKTAIELGIAVERGTA